MAVGIVQSWGVSSPQNNFVVCEECSRCVKNECGSMKLNVLLT